MSFEANLRLILGEFEAGQTRGSVGVDVFFFSSLNSLPAIRMMGGLNGFMWI
jgi:hypothetical protein